MKEKTGNFLKAFWALLSSRYQKKVENLWNSIQKFCKTLSFQKFISAKIDPPTKIDLQYKKPIQLTSNWATNMESYKDYGSVTKFCFLRQLRQNFMYSEDVNKIPG